MNIIKKLSTLFNRERTCEKKVDLECILKDKYVSKKIDYGCRKAINYILNENNIDNNIDKITKIKTKNKFYIEKSTYNSIYKVSLRRCICQDILTRETSIERTSIESFREKVKKLEPEFFQKIIKQILFGAVFKEAENGESVGVFFNRTDGKELSSPELETEDKKTEEKDSKSIVLKRKKTEELRDIINEVDAITPCKSNLIASAIV